MNQRASHLYLGVMVLSVSGWGWSQDAVGWRTDGSGVYPKAQPPLAWGEDQNVKWKTPLPGASNATPVLVGDRIFVCADPDELICLSVADGKILWQKSHPYTEIFPAEEKAKIQDEIKAAAALIQEHKQINGEFRSLGDQLKKAKTPEETQILKEKQATLNAKKEALQKKLDGLSLGVKYQEPATHAVNGRSSPTPVSDGHHVWCFFCNGMVACYDLEGNRKWISMTKPPAHKGWGQSSSPVLAGGVLIVPAGGFVHGFKPLTGEPLWEKKCGTSWGSDINFTIEGHPVLATPRGELYSTVDFRKIGGTDGGLEYNAPIYHEGILYYIQHGGRAVRVPDVWGEKLDCKVLWTTVPKKERYYASPIYDDGLIYAVTQTSHFTAIDAKDGKVVYEHELKLGGTAYPSIALAGSHLFVSSDSGNTVVIKTGRTYEEIGRNKLPSFRSSPVFADGRIFIRTYPALYCISK